MNNFTQNRSIEFLLVEDNPGDVRLILEAFRENKIGYNMHVAQDGIEAMKFLRREGPYSNAAQPDLILLDLNVAIKNGYEVLAEIKTDPVLLRIPVVIFTTSNAEQGILRTYNLHTNCFITKPVGLGQILDVMKSIEGFWVTVVTLLHIEDSYRYRLKK